MERYKNPDNSKEIIDGLQKLAAGNNVIDTINTYYPGWIKTVIPDYSPDYPRLKKNWETICESMKISRQSLVLVDVVYQDLINDKIALENYTVLIAACDVLGSKGYCIRRDTEFLPCEICGLALASKKLWNFLKINNLPCPKEWRKRCKDCVI